MATALRRLICAVVRPRTRLDPSFPLTGFKLGTTYIIATALFTVGSLLPAMIFLCFVLGLTKYTDSETSMRWLSPLMDKSGGFSDFTYLLLILSTFICGFCAELWYLRRAIRGSGVNLRVAAGLSLAPIKGKSKINTAWNLVWPVAVAYTLWFAFEQTFSRILNPPDQPTVDMMRQFSGSLLIVWVVMAALLAPMFEELVFRGFLFRALRATFHRWHNEAMATTPGGKPLHVRLSLWFGRNVFTTCGVADAAAICVSAACFSIEHMQFQPMTMLMLFLMGALLAELFRRTGTLWSSILLHAVNNFVAVMMVIHSR